LEKECHRAEDSEGVWVLLFCCFCFVQLREKRSETCVVSSSGRRGKRSEVLSWGEEFPKFKRGSMKEKVRVFRKLFSLFST
tara:strand:+ start:621 stop:863 length:243 start_codon:yes stop_codon:yes gene_type:complete